MAKIVEIPESNVIEVREIARTVDPNSDLSYLVPKSLFTNKGYIISGSGPSNPVNVPPGTDGQVLTVDSTTLSGLKWADAAAGSITAHAADTTDIHGIPDTSLLHSDSDFTSKGQIIVGSGSGAAVVLGVGTNGQVLTADSTTGSGLRWATGGGGGGDISTALSLAPDTATRNIVQPTAAGNPPLILRGAASQTANLFSVQDSSSNNRFSLDGNGDVLEHNPRGLIGVSHSVKYGTEANPRFLVVTTSGSTSINVGPGNIGADLNLYRSAANTWKTDDAFTAAGLITAKVGVAGQVLIANDGNGSIEMGLSPSTAAQSPYIDFHYAAASGVSQDYNTRIQNNADGKLMFSSVSAEGSTNSFFHDGILFLQPLLNSNTAVRNHGFGFFESLDNTLTGNQYRQIAELRMDYNRTNVSPPTSLQQAGFHVLSYKGTTAAAVGTSHCYTATNVIQGSGNAGNEEGTWVAFHRYENGALGRAWMTDFNLHGAINGQMSLISGVNMLINNYYNGQPSASPSYAHAAMTVPNGGGGGSGAHAAATTYPNGVGYWVLGRASGGTQRGWEVGFRVGSGGANAGGWNINNTRVGVGVQLQDWDTYGIYIPGAHGSASATKKSIYVANNAGEAHFEDGIIIGTIAGVPSDSNRDNDIDGQLAVDTLNNRLSFRSGGSWRHIDPTTSGSSTSFDNVAMIEELSDSVHYTATINATGKSVPVFIARFPCKVTAAALVCWNNGQAADNTNYWSVLLRRFRAGAAATIATKTTQATGGEAIVNKQEWDYDAISFNTTNQILQVGDVVEFQWNTTGTPAFTMSDILFTIRYEPT